MRSGSKTVTNDVFRSAALWACSAPFPILAFLVILSFPLDSQCQSSRESYDNYKAEIQFIHRSVVDLTASSDLFSVTNFLRLYGTPSNYLSNAALFLNEPTNSDVDKMIVVFSLQRLQLSDYINFETSLLAMAREKHISNAFFNMAIFPADDWNTQIQCGYDREIVKAFLARLEQSDLLNQSNKAYLKSIASGEACQNIREMIDAGVLPQHERGK